MIQLQRRVLVRTFDIEATVAVARDRPEFLAVARLAADLGRPIGGRDISRELLGNLPIQVGWRVLERAVSMGLLERDGHRGPARLSASGRAMLEQGAVLVPQEGVWRFHLVQDPLVPNELVHAERRDPGKAKAERDRLYKRQRGDRPERGRRPPRVLSSQIQTLQMSVADGGAFEVRDLGERGEDGPRGSVVLTLRWSPGGSPVVGLRGHLPGQEPPSGVSVDARLPLASVLAELDYDELWATLVEVATGVDGQSLLEWMDLAGAPVLPTTMEEWPPAARRSFQVDLEVPPVLLDELGEFEPSTLEAVKLVAESDAAAQEWAEWLLWDAIDGYVVPKTIDELRGAIAARFPLHRPRLPDARQLRDRALSSPRERTSRFILAPADLGLWS